MSQERLAELLDVSQSFVGLVERGERSFSINNLIAVAQLLDLSMDKLFCMDKIPENNHEPAKRLLQSLEALFTGYQLDDRWCRAIYSVVVGFIDVTKNA